MIYKIVLNIKKRIDFPSIIATEVYSDLSKIGTITEINPDIFSDENIDNIYKFEYTIENKDLKKDEIKSFIKELKKKDAIRDIKIIFLDNKELSAGKIVKRNIKSDLNSKTTSSVSTRSIRVDIEKLNNLGNLLGEFVINYSSIKDQINKTYNNFELSVGLESALLNLTKTLRKSELIMKELQYVALKMRMLPIDVLFSRFPRIVRDMGKKFNKDIELIIEGADTEIDKSIIEEINDPLIHIIRNAIDHGIEDKKTRKKLNKPEKAKILLKAYEESDLIIIQIGDDGRGIDIDKIKEKALELNIVNENDLERMSKEEIINFIFYPGFSTSEKVTELSGRGVGMDVVKSNIAKLNGRIEVETEKGKGTTFYLKLPLTLSIINILLVDIAGESVSIPIVNIIRIIKIKKEQISFFQNKMLVDIDERVMELFYLGDLLKFSNFENLKNKESEFNVLIIGSAEKKFAVIVDKILDKESVVIKKLNSYIGSIKGISGGTILGDGRVSLILDIRDLLY